MCSTFCCLALKHLSSSFPLQTYPRCVELPGYSLEIRSRTVSLPLLSLASAQSSGNAGPNHLYCFKRSGGTLQRPQPRSEGRQSLLTWDRPWPALSQLARRVASAGSSSNSPRPADLTQRRPPGTAPSPTSSATAPPAPWTSTPPAPPKEKKPPATRTGISPTNRTFSQTGRASVVDPQTRAPPDPSAATSPAPTPVSRTRLSRSDANAAVHDGRGSAHGEGGFVSRPAGVAGILCMAQARQARRRACGVRRCRRVLSRGRYRRRVCVMRRSAAGRSGCWWWWRWRMKKQWEWK